MSVIELPFGLPGRIFRSPMPYGPYDTQGTALEGREEAYRHRLLTHPERAQKRRTGRNLKSFHQPRMGQEQRDEIWEARDKRARLLGIDIRGEVA